ncbi:hypothetical protein CWI42_120570 [Ordospora colligata]|uniref:Mitochondrial import inner membrane translocase subunit TIM16 n=1 Tax=Ordospora colligata OC4 TaxID=1354746 RepID=A0A0B2UHP3_9MICR|nr:uncharacterized protein M896_120570 [Ordospora colligata OC4]KHN68838.1 hypothetical protein M896_120570 [Ordospora colligata OC4]TBU14061.1 hypothetical protein CWI41_120570 [Ordospora colligata]TBU17730.1 hypothetical protein CWI42_120570 [Ordospora colligata]
MMESVRMVLMREGARVIGRSIMATVCDIMLRNRMTKNEAEMILQIEAGTSRNEVKAVFTRMYDANSKENKGSAYLQSKILAAYSVLNR